MTKEDVTISITHNVIKIDVNPNGSFDKEENGEQYLVNIIGGCCGTKKEHVEAMHTALKSHQPKNRKDLNEIVESLGDMTEGNISLVKQYLDQNNVPKSKVNRKRRRRK